MDRVEYQCIAIYGGGEKTSRILNNTDALGQDAAPHDAAHPINTRESLASYDAGLFSLVSETMTYTGKVDWRFKQ